MRRRAIDPVRMTGRTTGFGPRAMLGVFALAATWLSQGCSRPSAVPENGALLLRVAIPQAGPVPDELRIWVYDQTGVLFRNARFPAQGRLPAPAHGTDLGTILIQPGVVVGALRIHVRGLAAGVRALDGVVVLGADMRDRATVPLDLGSEILPDDDGDDVPDPIDDCLPRPNPDQGGCPAPGTPDAAADDSGSPDTAVQVDGGSAPPDVADDIRTDTRADITEATDAASPDAPSGDAGTLPDARAPDAVAPDVRPADAAPADSGVSDGVVRDGASEAPPKALGAPCVVAGECGSGFCADGICCRTACNQVCQQCVLGTCIAVTRRQDVPQCAGTLTCNPVGQCVPGG